MKKLAGAIAAIGLAACGQSREVRPLSEDEQMLVDQIMDEGVHGEETVNHLVRSSTKKFFDVKGDEVGAEAFIDILNERRDKLREYHEAGRIVAYDEAAMPPGDVTREAIAYHQPLLDNDNEVIALNADVQSSWSYGVFMHELGHEAQRVVVPEGDENRNGHEDGLEKCLEGSDEAAAVKKMREVGDFAVEQSFVHLPTDDFMSQERDSPARVSFDAAKTVEEGGTVEEALAYYDAYVPTDREEWIVSTVDNHYILNHAAFSAEMGNSEEDIRESIRRGSLYEFTLTLYAEERAELERQLREFDESAEVKRARAREQEMPRPGKIR